MECCEHSKKVKVQEEKSRGRRNPSRGKSRSKKTPPVRNSLRNEGR